MNLGVVAFDSSSRSLKSKFINKIGNISRFFPNTNSRYLLRSIKTIQDNLKEYSVRLEAEFTFSKVVSIEEITKEILPKDDSSLIFSETKKTLDLSADSAIADLFSRLVKRVGKQELQILLTKLRVRKMRKDSVRPAARPRRGVKPPTMEEIDSWKHQSRKTQASK